MKDFIDHVTDLPGTARQGRCMRQAALSKAVGPRFIDRSDQSRCTVGGNQHRCRQPSFLHVPDEISLGGVALLIAQSHVQKHLLPVPTDPPGYKNAFLQACQTSQRLIHPLQEQILNLEVSEIPFAEGLIICPQLISLGH